MPQDLGTYIRSGWKWSQNFTILLSRAPPKLGSQKIGFPGIIFSEICFWSNLSPENLTLPTTGNLDMKPCVTWTWTLWFSSFDCLRALTHYIQFILYIAQCPPFLIGTTKQGTKQTWSITRAPHKRISWSVSLGQRYRVSPCCRTDFVHVAM